MERDFDHTGFLQAPLLRYLLPGDEDPYPPYQDPNYRRHLYSGRLVPGSAWHHDDFLLSAEDQSIARIYRNIMYPEYNQGDTE